MKMCGIENGRGVSGGLVYETGRVTVKEQLQGEEEEEEEVIQF